MKKITQLIFLFVAAPPLTMHAVIGSGDLVKYVEILLARYALCIHKDATRDQRMLSDTEKEVEIKDCETEARLLKKYAARLDKIVAETDELPDANTVLFPGSIKNISINRSKLDGSESFWKKLLD